MMPQQHAERPLERLLVHVPVQLYRHGLVEMVRIDWVRSEEPVLDRGECGRTDDRFQVGLLAVRRGGHQRELGDSLMEEDVLGAQQEPGLSNPGNELNTQDRVPTELEEVVLDPDPFQSEDLGPYLG
jgi:hypothetical protein